MISCLAITVERPLSGVIVKDNGDRVKVEIDILKHCITKDDKLNNLLNKNKREN